MAVFFILLGVTVGLYTASFTLKRRRLFSVILPSVSASLVTLLMYIGEMILLSGHLYRFGNGFFFMGLGAILLAPVDLLIILLSGILTAALALLLTKQKNARSA